MPCSAFTSTTPPPTGTGIPPSATAAEITLVINALDASSGPRPLWSAQGARRLLETSEVKVRSSHGAAGSKISGAVPMRPRVPKRLRALRRSLNDLRFHRSAPRRPKARSIFPMNSPSMPSQAALSPRRSNSAAVAAASVKRIALPSLQITPVGAGVFLYSTPRFSRSGASSAYAGPPTKSGCQLARSSCV